MPRCRPRLAPLRHQRRRLSPLPLPSCSRRRALLAPLGLAPGAAGPGAPCLLAVAAPAAAARLCAANGAGLLAAGPDAAVRTPPAPLPAPPASAAPQFAGPPSLFSARSRPRPCLRCCCWCCRFRCHGRPSSHCQRHLGRSEQTAHCTGGALARRRFVCHRRCFCRHHRLRRRCRRRRRTARCAATPALHHPTLLAHLPVLPLALTLLLPLPRRREALGRQVYASGAGGFAHPRLGLPCRPHIHHLLRCLVVRPCLLGPAGTYGPQQ